MSYQWWAFLNLLTCSAIAYICVGRLAMCHPGVVKLVRVKYTVLVTGSLAYGFQPILFNDWPSPGGVIFALPSRHRSATAQPPPGPRSGGKDDNGVGADDLA